MADIQEDDYLLLLGAPVAMGLVSIVAAEYVSKVNILYWSGKAQEYRVSSFDLDGEQQ